MKSLKTRTQKTKLKNGSLMVPKDDDADYKPVLQGIINTRCNYDGAKIEGTMEG
ncbi:hypothetical protein [Methanomethylovorans sp.]|uniref:hypothetical protein n=1 Tax=Methanomethylovorans sp. TaxID=2758717 RepID=UPI00351C11B9